MITVVMISRIKIFKQPDLAAGTKFSESKLLEYSVVLLGLTVTFQTIGEMGIKGLKEGISQNDS
jgi:uncharacterized membrane protein YadS